MKEFKGKVAVVTGAASGIGRSLAEKCIKEGMKVVLADIEDVPLKATETAFKAQGADVLAVKTDVRKFKDVEALAQRTLDTYGAVHLLFNNAGVIVGGAIWEPTLNDWEWVLGVNLWGVIHGMKAFLPIMLQQKTECHIVNTASGSGLIATGIYDGAYRVTKHAVVSFSEALYTDLKMYHTKIGVSVLCPAEVRTNIINYERNRPAELQNPPAEGIISPEVQAAKKAVKEYKQKAIQDGMPPEQCAETTFNGIREDRLYILTHPYINNYIKERADNILTGKNPPVPGQ